MRTFATKLMKDSGTVMANFKVLLLPLAWLYHGITAIRNHLFDIGYKKSFEFDRAVVSVGNLNVGGSGKTPLVEYLIERFSLPYHTVTLSRGYGRKSRGFRMAGATDDATTLGDEPFQLYQKYKDKIGVAVGEERAFAIPMILHELPETDVILLDDAFQHRTVKPTFSILVGDFSNPFFEDYLLPYGRLRESRSGAKRADVVVITKCPLLLSGESMDDITKNVAKYCAAPVFFTSLAYKDVIPFYGTGEIRKKVILVTGIAKGKPMREYVENRFEVVRHFDFPDHHFYSRTNIVEIEKEATQANASVLTTEKDYARLCSPKWKETMDMKNWFYLPVRSVFLKNGSEFDRLVESVLKSQKD